MTLSKLRLICALCLVIQEVKVDSSHYSGNSFRIGVATATAKLGVSESLIKVLGRWKFSAFTRYIWTPWEQLVQVSSLWSGGDAMDRAGLTLLKVLDDIVTNWWLAISFVLLL